jgi:MFS transporter, DHA1 family, multidrug resistance protein
MSAAASPPSEKMSDLVDWDGPDDPENPQNWTTRKKAFTTILICILTFSIYSGSAIYTTSIPGLMVHFGCSSTEATLGLSLFVIGK